MCADIKALVLSDLTLMLMSVFVWISQWTKLVRGVGSQDKCIVLQ